MIFENDSDSKKDYYEKHSEEAARRRTIRPTSYSGLGKLPPQAIDLEEAILGALMLEKDAFFNVSDFLTPDCFYKDNHQKIYNAIYSLFKKGLPIDILTVVAELRQLGELDMIGGAYYITNLTDRVASSANIEYHARIVYQKYLQREMIRISTESIQCAYEDTTDVIELIEQNQLQLFNLTAFNMTQKSELIGDLILQELEDQNKPALNGLTGVGTGLTALDNYCSGWQPGELTIIAARPAMGKTAFMMQIARNAAIDFDKPVQVFSLEMTKKQLVKRMISNESEIFLEKFNKKTLNEWDKQELHSKLLKLQSANIHIDDTAGLSIVQFRSKCIRAKKLYDIQLIVIDYLQLMVGDNSKRNGNRDQEIGIIMRGLKAVAKELNVPVIALSQLSRAAENRPGSINRPQLKDLRESGNIEQDADNVYFLYRPSYYGITQDENGQSTEQMAELINAKHRNGPCETLYFKFRGAVMRFEDWVKKEIFNAGNHEPINQQNHIQNTWASIVPRIDADEQEELPF